MTDNSGDMSTPHEPLGAQDTNSRPPFIGDAAVVGGVIQIGLVVLYTVILYIFILIMRAPDYTFYLPIIVSPVIFGAISFISGHLATHTYECVFASLVSTAPFGLFTLNLVFMSVSYGQFKWEPIIVFGSASVATFLVSYFAARNAMRRNLLKRRVVEGQCPMCGYSTEGLPGDVCPECGSEY